METKVFIVEKSLAVKIVGDSDIKRKADAVYYDASVFGMKEGTVLIVSGDEEIFKMEFFKGLEEAKNKDEILGKQKEMEDNSSAGIGNLFG